MKDFIYKMVKIFTILILLIICQTTSAQIAVVVNPENNLEEITLKDLKRFYLGEITIYKNGTDIYLIELDSLKEEFYKTTCNLSSKKIRKYWMKMIFSGENLSPPDGYENIQSALEVVIKKNGAICFVPFNEVDSTVKILKIDGYLPEDKNYPLK